MPRDHPPLPGGATASHLNPKQEAAFWTSSLKVAAAAFPAFWLFSGLYLPSPEQVRLRSVPAGMGFPEFQPNLQTEVQDPFLGLGHPLDGNSPAVHPPAGGFHHPHADLYPYPRSFRAHRLQIPQKVRPNPLPRDQSYLIQELQALRVHPDLGHANQPSGRANPILGHLPVLLHPLVDRRGITPGFLLLAVLSDQLNQM